MLFVIQLLIKSTVCVCKRPNWNDQQIFFGGVEIIEFAASVRSFPRCFTEFRSLKLPKVMSTKEYRIGKWIQVIFIKIVCFLFIVAHFSLCCFPSIPPNRFNQTKALNKAFSRTPQLMATSRMNRHNICNIFRIASGVCPFWCACYYQSNAIATCYHTKTDRKKYFIYI